MLKNTCLSQFKVQGKKRKRGWGETEREEKM
jgi:hypothetical protein